MRIYVLSTTLNNEIQDPIVYRSFNSAMSELTIQVWTTMGYTEAEMDRYNLLKPNDDSSIFNVDWKGEYATAQVEALSGNKYRWAIHKVEV